MGTNDSRADWALIARVVSGSADPLETARLESWMGDDVRRRALVESTRALWTQAGTPEEPVDVDTAVARVKGLVPPRRRVLRFPGVDEAARGAHRRHSAWLVARVAVAGAIAAGAVLWLTARHDVRAGGAPIRISEVSTRRGERAQIRLPDGTKLVLGPVSKVRYASDYGVTRREISLEGQALFAVVHDAARPFVVRTPHALATDLGTTFVVRAYGEDAGAEIVVADGKVAVSRSAGAGPPPATILGPGDIAAVDAGGVRVRHGVATGRYLAWTTGRLVFDDTPLSEVVAQLGRWYDVDARAVDSVAARRRLTASYSDESLADVLQLIAASLDLRVERHGRGVTFTVQRAPHTRGDS